MAAAAAAALLDELMGRNRNVGPNEKVVELNWEDPEYCKFYLVKFCPHDLFVNTRADLGACAKIHDDEVKRLFDLSTSHRKIQYIEEFIRCCNNILSDVERKIEKGKQRLVLMNSNDHVALTPAQTQKNTEQIALLSQKINKLVEEAEAAGIEGNVEQAQGLMKLCDQLKDERHILRKQIDNSQFQQTANLASEQEKQMEVCEVCGAFLIVGDAQQRIDDHLMGKQHVGYSRLKSSVNEMAKIRDELRLERDKKWESERRDRYNNGNVMLRTGTSGSGSVSGGTAAAATGGAAGAGSRRREDGRVKNDRVDRHSSRYERRHHHHHYHERSARDRKDRDRNHHGGYRDDKSSSRRSRDERYSSSSSSSSKRQSSGHGGSSIENGGGGGGTVHGTARSSH